MNADKDSARGREIEIKKISKNIKRYVCIQKKDLEIYKGCEDMKEKRIHAERSGYIYRERKKETEKKSYRERVKERYGERGNKKKRNTAKKMSGEEQ